MTEETAAAAGGSGETDEWATEAAAAVGGRGAVDDATTFSGAIIRAPPPGFSIASICFDTSPQNSRVFH